VVTLALRVTTLLTAALALTWSGLVGILPMAIEA
jgi:hypothetical protein